MPVWQPPHSPWPRRASFPGARASEPAARRLAPATQTSARAANPPIPTPCERPHPQPPTQETTASSSPAECCGPGGPRSKIPARAGKNQDAGQATHHSCHLPAHSTIARHLPPGSRDTKQPFPLPAPHNRSIQHFLRGLRARVRGLPSLPPAPRRPLTPNLTPKQSTGATESVGRGEGASESSPQRHARHQPTFFSRLRAAERHSSRCPAFQSRDPGFTRHARPQDASQSDARSRRQLKPPPP